MEILKFIIQNWDNILLIAATLAVLIFLIAKRRWDLLQDILFGLVTEAEREYGGGTGALKRAKVIEWLYPQLPASVQAIITREKLDQMIDQALVAARRKWNRNPVLIDQIPFPEVLEESETETGE